MATSAAVSDFVNVQLSAAGVAFAGVSGTVRVGNGHFDYTWTVGQQVRVLTSEWRKCLAKMVSQGKPIFEAAAAPPSLTDLKAQQAKINAEIAAAEAAGAK